MFTDLQTERFADVLIWALKTARTGKFKKRDLIYLQYDPAAVKLAEILYDRILSMGMHCVQRMGLTVSMEKSFYAQSDDAQLTFIAPGDRELIGRINGRIFLRAPDSLTHLKDADPGKIGKTLVSRKPLREIMDKREDEGVYSWTLTSLPTAELARQAKLSLPKYTEQVVKACYLDEENPVACWQAIYTEVKGIKKWLDSYDVRSFHVESKHCDLVITPGEKRKWVGVSGHNMPSFEIFTSPDWRGTAGSYYADFPSFRSGNYVKGVRLVFKKGQAVAIDAETGGEFTKQQLAMDQGACRIGEFSLTDKRFSRIDRFMADTLFDENHGGKFGNCHIAVGASYSTAYDGDPKTLTKAAKKKLGFNDSALHWDLVNTEDKTVTAHLAGGKKVIIYDNGQFKY
ncbi:MAG: aminopeptidase [Deltaproteobacteria bacterium]|nr:aminopeptidase [Deltaproteobacteria bacterium]